MKRAIFAATVGMFVFFLTVSATFLFSVNQAKTIVEHIENKDYVALENACQSALNIDQVPVYSQVFHAFGEVNVWTPLQTACQSGDIQAATILLENGANPNKTPPFQVPWYAPIQLAAADGNVELMALLIDYGADLETTGHNALVNLTKDARYGANGISFEKYKSGYELLEKHGMDASHPSFDNCPLLRESALLSDIEVTDYLISEKGISATVCDSDNRTLLHFACLSGFTDTNPDYIQYLLDCGIDPTIQDTYGKTAYDYAVEEGLTDIAQMLIGTS